MSGGYRKRKAHAVKDNKCFSVPVFGRPGDEDEGKPGKLDVSRRRCVPALDQLL